MTQEMIKYQELDAKLRKLEKELAEIPERKKAAEMQNLLKDGQLRLASLEGNAQKSIENFEKAKSYYNELIIKVEALSKAIEGANLEKIKELQQTKNNFYLMIDKLEKELVKINAQLVMVNNEYNTIIKNAKSAKANLDLYKTKFAANKEALEPKIAAVKKELTEASKAIDKTILEKYKLKRENKFPVFVRNVNGTCGGCRMAISASKMRDLNSNNFTECENCARIIYKD